VVPEVETKQPPIGTKLLALVNIPPTGYTRFLAAGRAVKSISAC
jgi:hypothetical protein